MRESSSAIDSEGAIVLVRSRFRFCCDGWIAFRRGAKRGVQPFSLSIIEIFEHETDSGVTATGDAPHHSRADLEQSLIADLRRVVDAADRQLHARVRQEPQALGCRNRHEDPARGEVACLENLDLSFTSSRLHLGPEVIPLVFALIRQRGTSTMIAFASVSLG